MIDERLREAFRFFHEHGVGWVGHQAVAAMMYARAELWAKDEGIEATWEDEDESYESVYGEKLPDDVEGPYFVGVKVAGEHLAGLGMVTLSTTARGDRWPNNGIPRDPYARVVEAELFSEARDTILERRDAEATRLAETLSERVTYAGVSP